MDMEDIYIRSGSEVADSVLPFRWRWKGRSGGFALLLITYPFR